ncbi:MAG: thioredoxin domain-containing protein [Anaerolineae bacterium]|nr:thioredoxin domain-containing protein [Anaerolineae bacterium]
MTKRRFSRWLGLVLLCAAVAITGCGQASPSAEATSYGGTPVGFTADGAPYRGDPEAPVTLVEYSDYLCPFCARHHEQTWPALLDEYVRAGSVQYVFRDLPLEGLHPTAPVGHAAARCVGEQGAGLYWTMHDALFRDQAEWSGLADPSDYLAGVVKGLGADVAAYQACVDSGRADATVAADIAAGQALGFNGTPSFQFVDNRTGSSATLVGAQPLAAFKERLDALIAGEELPTPEPVPTAEPPELPYWANAEGLAPDPARPGYTLAGDPYKGDPEAPLVVVEFSDFQCPACRRHTLEAQPALDERFVETGEIMWVYKHLLLQEYPQGPAAAAAAECAGDQGKFWEMHDLLFEAQETWSVDEPGPVLLDLAAQVGLDVEGFEACFGSREALERVLVDLYDAQGVASTTPSFIVLGGGRGAIFRGAKSAEEYIEVLENMRDSLGVE